MQLAYVVATYDENWNEIDSKQFDVLMNPGVPIPKQASDIHGKTDELVKDAPSFKESIGDFLRSAHSADVIVGHNVQYDFNVLKWELERTWKSEEKREAYLDSFWQKTLCTMLPSTILCKIPHPKFRNLYKWPKLQELHQFLFGEEFENAHDALGDILATKKCFEELVARGVLKP